MNDPIAEAQRLEREADAAERRLREEFDTGMGAVDAMRALAETHRREANGGRRDW